VAERSKAHAWKVCIRHNRIVGSNPTPSAIYFPPFSTVSGASNPTLYPGLYAMHGRHLTRRGDAYIFQIRLPRDLDPNFTSAPVRLNLGRVQKRYAQRAARLLAAAASIAFVRIRTMPPEHSRDLRQLVTDLLKRDLSLVTPFFAALDCVDACKPSDPALRPKMIELGLDGLADLTVDRIHATNSSAICVPRGRRPLCSSGEGRRVDGRLIGDEPSPSSSWRQHRRALGRLRGISPS
jgi:hypothetical protein